jgi:hypothetical protein
MAAYAAGAYVPDMGKLDHSKLVQESEPMPTFELTNRSYNLNLINIKPAISNP